MSATLNTTQLLTCESQGQESLSLCLWVRPTTGVEKEGIFIDQQVVNDGGRTNVDGISYVCAGLDDRKCSIRIESLTGAYFGRWFCTSMTTSGQIFAGNVIVHAAGKCSALSLNFCVAISFLSRLEGNERSTTE